MCSQFHLNNSLLYKQSLVDRMDKEKTDPICAAYSVRLYNGTTSKDRVSHFHSYTTFNTVTLCYLFAAQEGFTQN